MWSIDWSGGRRRVLAHKFPSCMDKGISVSVVQMKCVIVAVMRNFDFEMVEGHTVLQMKNDILVKDKQR
jgi:hypothetical protein